MVSDARAEPSPAEPSRAEGGSLISVALTSVSVFRAISVGYKISQDVEFGRRSYELL